MKKWLLLVVIGVVALSTMAFTGSFKKLWAKYDTSVEQGLPKTGIEILSKIQEKAKNKKDIGHYFKATYLKAEQSMSLGYSDTKKNIQELEDWLAGVDTPDQKAILSAILLSNYLDYFNNNRYKFNELTDIESSEKPSQDIDQWTVNQYQTRINDLYDSVWTDPELLLNKSAKDYTPFIEIHDFGKYFDHDLYHVLYTFTLNVLNNYPYGPGWRENLASDLRDSTITLYAKNPNALLLLKLDGLTSDRNFMLGIKEKIDCIDKLIEQNSSSELVVEAVAVKINLLLAQRKESNLNYPELIELAESYIKKYPKYIRIGMLSQIVEQIKAPSVSLTVRKYAHTNENIITGLRYKNVNKIGLSLYEWTGDSAQKLSALQERLDEKETAEDFLTKNSKLVDQFDLNGIYTTDHKLVNDTVLDISVPTEGLYVIALDADKSESVSYQLVTVQNTTLIRQSSQNHDYDFFTVDLLSGAPVKGVDIKLYPSSKADSSHRKQVANLFTDQSGRASWVVPESFEAQTYLSLVAQINGQTIYDDNERTIYAQSKEQNPYSDKITYKLITDRRLYRPGQMVYVKGYIYQQDSITGKYRVVPNYNGTMNVRDNSSLVIADVAFKTNDFGSFTTQVQLPSSMLNGNVSFTVSNEQGSQQTVLVEEYKRPTFALSFLPIEGAYKWGDTVTLRGKVESFSQSMLTNARLEAEVSFYDYSQGKSRVVPCIFIQPRASQVSLKDGLVIDSEGNFALEVSTLENLQGSYEVKVKLVSADGETHEEQTNFYVSETPYRVFTTVPAVVDLNAPLALDFAANNSDGTPVEAKGEYKLFKKADEYEKGESILKGSFDTENKKVIDITSLPVGSYVLAIYGEDGKMSSSNYFQAFSKMQTAVPVDKGEWLYVEKNTFSKNEPAVVYFGATEKDVHLFVDVYTLKGKVYSENIILDQSYTKLELPFDQTYRSGAVVVFTYYKNHQLYTRRVSLTLDAKEENLSLSWLTFRDKINAGAQQEWILQVLDAQGKPTTDVELLALMYDASLDELTPAYMRSESRFYFNNVSLPSVDVYSSARNYRNTIYSKFSVDQNRKSIPEYSFDKFFFFEQFRPRMMIRGMSRAKASYNAEDRQYEEMSEVVLTGAVNAAPQAITPEVAADAGASNQSGDVPAIRSNFDETAFFKPSLTTDKSGKVKIRFTSPEQLTKWNVQVYAHNKDMIVGYSDKIAFTQRKFAIQMNAPRFIRQGDKVMLSSILKNAYPNALQSSVELVLFDPITDKQIGKFKQTVAVQGNSESTVSFDLPMLSGRSEVGIRILATAGKHSDGEQYVVPILSNIEPFISGKSVVEVKPGQKKIDLSDLFGDNSKTAQHKEVLVEFTSNPLWFAVDPILRTWMSDSRSSLSLSNKLSVSGVAYELWQSNPEFIKSFTKDNSFKSFDNNAEFRTILNQETPWAAMPTNQNSTLSMFHSEVIKNTSQLQLRGYLDQLKSLQGADGGFSWYENMDSSAQVTLLVAQNLFDFSRTIGVDPTNAALAGEMTDLALNYLYATLFKSEDIKDIVMPSVSQMQVVVLGMSQKLKFSKEQEKQNDLVVNLLPAVLKEGSLMQRALALQLSVLGGQKKLANSFQASLIEYLLDDATDSGVHFGGTQFDKLPLHEQLDTHIAAMKALELWQSNQERLNGMKFWLATKLNNEKVYNEFTAGAAISAIGMDSPKTVVGSERLTINLGKQLLVVDTKNPFVKQTIKIDQTTPEMVIDKTGNQVVWGRVIGKYYAPITDVKSSGSTIQVDTKYYLEQVVDGKKELKPLTDKSILQAGDVLVSRVNFKLEQDLDYVQITDSRAGNLEPTVTNSGYRWNSLLRGRQFIPSYTSVRDASTQYFFYSLEMGSYILENRSFVVRGGTYQTGTVTIQSAYSPELSGYSGSQIIQSK